MRNRSPESNRKSIKTNQDKLKQTFASDHSSTLVYEIKPSSTLPLLPTSVNLRPTRTFYSTMGSNTSSHLGNEATCGIRDTSRMETENESERANEHPEETNRKSHDLFPVSNTSHTTTSTNLSWLNSSEWQVTTALWCYQLVKVEVNMELHTTRSYWMSLGIWDHRFTVLPADAL